MKKAILLTLLSLSLLLAGCSGQQTATQQIMQQTSDPYTISMATYLDGLNAYVEAQRLYIPYQQIIEENNPVLGEKIKGYFKQARDLLKKWKAVGSLSPENQQSFRETLRNISIEMAKQMEGK